MAALSLDRPHTALLIADFYAAIMSTLPHAVDRQVVERTQRLQRAARVADLFVCYCATVFRPGYVEISERESRSLRRANTPANRRLAIPCSSSTPLSCLWRAKSWLASIG